MKQFNIALAQENENRRQAERRALAAEARLRKQRRRPRNAKPTPPPINLYQLLSNGQPTGETLMTTHYEAMTLNKALRAHFVKHVNECLDAGIPTTKHIQQWRLKTHANDLPPAA